MDEKDFDFYIVNMKLSSLNFDELNQFCLKIQPLVQGCIQDVLTSQQGIGFFIWKPHKKTDDENTRETVLQKGQWLWIDLKPTSPLPLLLDASEFKKLPIKKSTKPPGLFVKSHILGKVISQIYCETSKGRVLFIEGRGFSIEVRLFPHGQNIIFNAEDKTISWHQVKELQKMGHQPSQPIQASQPTLQNQESQPRVVSQIPIRDINKVKQEWLLSFSQNTSKKQPSMNHFEAALKSLRKDHKKKQNALLKIQESLDEKKEEKWFSLGKTIQEIQSLDVEHEYSHLLDPNKPLNWNIQKCFDKYKVQKNKLSGTKDRLNLLKKEFLLLDDQIKILEKNKEDGFEKSNWLKLQKNLSLQTHQTPQTQKSNPNLLFQAQAKGRKLSLPDQKEVVMGKSARDNLAILRKAKAWYLWVHVKDKPSAHAIISCKKKEKIPDEQIIMACRWLLKESEKKAQAGDKWDFLVTECRYVNPIKGDKLGRVQYKNERVFTVQV